MNLGECPLGERRHDASRNCPETSLSSPPRQPCVMSPDSARQANPDLGPKQRNSRVVPYIPVKLLLKFHTYVYFSQDMLRSNRRFVIVMREVRVHRVLIQASGRPFLRTHLHWPEYTPSTRKLPAANTHELASSRVPGRG